MLPTFQVENLGAAGSVPFTFGQVFVPGEVKNGDFISASGIELQIDGKAKHADGSLRHAILSGVAEGMVTGEVRKYQLEKTAPRIATALVPKTGLDLVRAARVEITVDGIKYTAAPDPAKVAAVWLQGPIVDEWHVDAPLRDPAGALHPQLTVRMAARVYAAMPKDPRIEIVVENCKTFTPGARKYTYDIAMFVRDQKVFAQAGLAHYHHARWRRVFGLVAGEVKHDIDYLIRSRAVSNYDRTQTPTEKDLAAIAAKITPAMLAPMAIGPLNPAMGTTGGRPDIGPLPSWYVSYLLTMDKRAKLAMLAVAEGSGSWSIHYRDENTGHPVRIDTPANNKISTHMNLANRGPLPVPRYANGDSKMFATPYQHDTAHQPSMAYLPYLLTGEYYYLEDLLFWAAYNPLETDPANHGNGLGLVKWQQLRGQAWSLRTLGHAAYITPDVHPLKDYFTKQVQNNIEFYHQTYVVGNPNALGMYDGSGRGSFQNKEGAAPWQDDFFTWSLGYLAELGFEGAAAILNWKARFVVGRMTAPGYCWIHASAYYLKYRDASGSPVKTFADLYALNFTGASIPHDAKVRTHPGGVDFMTTLCNSQAQLDWFAAAGIKWKLGRMSGYADSVEGYPANMQPALATAVTLGVPGAAEAWEKYESRVDKPSWSKGAQFNIVPRPVPVAEAEPPQPPAPNERCLVEAAIQRYTAAPDETAPEQRALAQEVFGLLLDSERARTMVKQ